MRSSHRGYTLPCGSGCSPGAHHYRTIQGLGAAYPEAIPTWWHHASPSPPGRCSGTAPGKDRAPTRSSHSKHDQGQPLSLPVCFQGGCLCCCSEWEVGLVLQSREVRRRRAGGRCQLPIARSFPLPFISQDTRDIIAPSPFSACSCQASAPRDLSGRWEGAMPYLYRDLKPRSPALPGTACATHSSGKAYEELKQECLRRGVLFEDPDFPACDSSLFFSEKPPIPFIWKRPRVSMTLHSLLSSSRKSDPAMLWDCTKPWCVQGDEVQGRYFPPQGKWCGVGMSSTGCSSCGMRGLEGFTPCLRCSSLYSHTLWTCIYVCAQTTGNQPSLLHDCQTAKMKIRGRARN